MNMAITEMTGFMICHVLESATLHKGDEYEPTF